MNIVLVEPEIPQNTGNIARTCAVTSSALFLVRPLGFSTDNCYLKRAGLDYWDKLKVYYYNSIYDLLNDYQENNFYFASTKAPNIYSEVSYKPDDFIVFGKETAGLPEELLIKNINNCIRIPMGKEQRSLNLSNSVAIILYEALHQLNFPGLIIKGILANK